MSEANCAIVLTNGLTLPAYAIPANNDADRKFVDGDTLLYYTTDSNNTDIRFTYIQPMRLYQFAYNILVDAVTGDVESAGMFLFESNTTNTLGTIVVQQNVPVNRGTGGSSFSPIFYATVDKYYRVVLRFEVSAGTQCTVTETAGCLASLGSV